MSNTGHEFEFIARIRSQVASHPRVPLGIGDDAALVLVGKEEARLLVTTDVLLEGVHFDFSQATPREVGRKALAVNLSDLAAMAGRPTTAFVGLVLSRSQGSTFADELIAGLHELACEFDVTVAGGDTNIWTGPTVLSVTLLGEATGQGPVLRSGAQADDWLMVTGRLGGSLCGRHLRFIPRVREAALLHDTVDVHAMIDLSDGLASDVQHLLTESHVGARLDPLAIPIHSDVDPSVAEDQRRQRALSDGEDFELLFAVPPEAGERLLHQPLFDTPLTKIGELTNEPGCWLVQDDGSRVPLEPTGWQHRFDE